MISAKFRIAELGGKKKSLTMKTKFSMGMFNYQNNSKVKVNSNQQVYI